MKRWKRLPYNEAHKIGWRHIMIKKFIDPAGNEQEFGIYDKEGTKMAAVIALTEDNKVVVARQFRQGPELVMDELPGGGVNKEEDPETAALRELLEETGYVPKSIEFIGVARKEAYRNGVHHYYLARGCTQEHQPNPDEGEFVEPQEITIEQLIQNAKNGLLTDSVAVLLAYEELQKLI